MACAEVSQILGVQVPADMKLEIILSSLAGLLIVLIIILTLLTIRYRKVIVTKIKKCCFGCCCTAGGICYCCCHRGAVKGNDHANAYLLPSWDEPSERPTEEGTEEGEDGGVEGEGKGEEEKVRSFMERLEILRSNGHPFAQSLVLSNPDFILHVGGEETDDGLFDPTAVMLKRPMEDMEEESVGGPYQVATAETSFNEGATEENLEEDNLEAQFSEPAEPATKSSFADILVAPKEKQHGMLYDCFRGSIMKLESSFLQNFVDFIGLRVEILATDLVIAEQATEGWRVKLMDSCNKIIGTAQTGEGSYTATGTLGRNCPDVNTIMTQVANEVYSSLGEADITPDKAEELMTGFERDFGKFEMLFSTLYLQETKKLESRTNLKEVLLDLLINNMKELLEEMTTRHKGHIKLLEKLQMKSSLEDFSVSALDKFACEVDKIWTSATRKFKKALAEQMNVLKNDSNLRMDRSSPKYDITEDYVIKEKKEQLKKRDISMAEFIDAYCSELRDLLSVETKQDHIEVNFTATEFNALMEMLGVKYLKRAIKAEKVLFAQIAGHKSQELVAQLEIDLNNQQASLRSTRQKQEQKLRGIMNSPSLGPPLVELYFDELRLDQDFIGKTLEIQVDMSEVEQRHLKETAAARLCTCEVQFELKKQKHERRLKYELRSKKAQYSSKKEAKFLKGSDSNAMVVLKLKQEEKDIETTQRKVVAGIKSNLSASLQSTKKSLELLLQQRSDRIRRAHEANANLASKQERALNVLKSKLLDKISNSSATDQVTGERLLQEYHINLQVLDEELKRSKIHQEQVLQQKIQSRKLEKMEESKHLMQEQSRTEPYRIGSAKRFAADCLVGILMDVRHKQNLKQLDSYNHEEGGKLKSQLERRMYINSKLALQLREREMILKLASALNMSRSDLEQELKNSIPVAEKQIEGDDEAGLLLTKSVLKLFETDTK